MVTRPRIGSLCSGFGGLDRSALDALQGGSVVWHAETDPDASRVLKAAGPDVPNHGDITMADWSDVEPIDILAAGFPCQPVSAAGRQQGQHDERWLWHTGVMPAVTALRPRGVIFENVRNLVSTQRGALFAGILADLRGAGYAVRWCTVGACAFGLPHHRHRVFALGLYIGANAPEAVRLAVPECGAPRSGGRILLPTPTVGDSRNSRNATADRRDGAAFSAGITLSDVAYAWDRPEHAEAAKLLPTLRGPVGAQSEHWGEYAEAVAAWEAISGVPAPAPTEPNANGAPRLAPGLVEWMMNVPAGMIAGQVDRNAALRLLGNGVVRRQGAGALSLLLDAPMTRH